MNGDGVKVPSAHDTPVTEVPEGVSQVAVTVEVHADSTLTMTFQRVPIDSLDALFDSLASDEGKTAFATKIHDAYAAEIQQRTEQEAGSG